MNESKNLLKKAYNFTCELNGKCSKQKYFWENVSQELKWKEILSWRQLSTGQRNKQINVFVSGFHDEIPKVLIQIDRHVSAGTWYTFNLSINEIKRSTKIFNLWKMLSNMSNAMFYGQSISISIMYLKQLAWY
jgi:hypothetical protein